MLKKIFLIKIIYFILIIDYFSASVFFCDAVSIKILNTFIQKKIPNQTMKQSIFYRFNENLLCQNSKCNYHLFLTKKKNILF